MRLSCPILGVVCRFVTFLKGAATPVSLFTAHDGAPGTIGDDEGAPEILLFCVYLPLITSADLMRVSSNSFRDCRATM